ncbi:hypothetical protein CRUP_037018 [Coryphaenoides rupestris]|nr:hypothetical protein CRUP_037018 [Coryphaenoides rupestris]
MSILKAMDKTKKKRLHRGLGKGLSRFAAPSEFSRVGQAVHSTPLFLKSANTGECAAFTGHIADTSVFFPPPQYPEASAKVFFGSPAPSEFSRVGQAFRSTPLFLKSANTGECAAFHGTHRRRHLVFFPPPHTQRQGPVKPEQLSIQWSGRRSNRRVQRNSSLSPNNPLLSLVNSGVYDEDSQWTTQVNRLQKLIDRLEKKHILMVQRQLCVLQDEGEEFRVALRQYMDCASAQTGCLHVAVQRLPNESRFILYEFWEHNSVWKNHLQTNYSKSFQRGNVDFLETPEMMTTMSVPASWWLINNN